MDTLKEHLRGYSLPRKANKPDRLFIDHEYVTAGYARHVPHSATAIYLVLARYANYHTQTCFPSVETIMRDTGITNRTTAFRGLKLLENHHLIHVEHSTGRRPNHYTLLDTTCWTTVG